MVFWPLAASRATWNLNSALCRRRCCSFFDIDMPPRAMNSTAFITLARGPVFRANYNDLHKFFAVIDDVRDRAMFTLMLRCGLRIAEVASLQLVDLYLDEARPRLVTRGKGSKERSAYLSPQAERTLRAYLTERPRATCNVVFLSYLDAGMSTTAIHKRLMVYRERAAVAITAHRLGRTFANDLVSVDVPVTSIQK